MRIRWLTQVSRHFFPEEAQPEATRSEWPHPRPRPYTEWHSEAEYLDAIVERLSVKLGLPRTTDISTVLGEAYGRLPPDDRRRPWANLRELAVFSNLPLDGWVHVIGDRDVPAPEAEHGYRSEPGVVLIRFKDLIDFENIFVGEHGWILDEAERWIIHTFEHDGLHAYGDLYRF